MEKLLTIVIAAYNKEDLLPRCLDSLIVAPEFMEKVQVLVINDGSKDNTLAVAKEYEKRYPDYFHAIDKPNGNYGSVMNKGLALAEGKYFRTLDADDWYDTNSYKEFLMQLADTDADMILNERYTYYVQDNRKELLSFPDGVILNTDLDVSASMWQHDMLEFVNVQHLTYKTELIRQSGLKWIEHICYTDTLYDYWPLRLVKTVRFMKLPVYVYAVGIIGQSISFENIRKNHSHRVRVADAMIDELAAHYDVNSIVFPIQVSLVQQICRFIYIDLTFSNEHLSEILRIHKKLDRIPEVKKFIIDNLRWHSIRYLKHLDKGKLPLILRIFRFIFR